MVIGWDALGCAWWDGRDVDESGPENKVAELAQIFNPSFAATHLDVGFIDRLSVVKPIAHMVEGLKK